ncbi:alpha/beta fold hydrolase [Actinopolymorpha pittospori]|uniref:Pimeloyl-ACP methyl ester carboxylesterase n=1 Tax=Actinopolymorpha pittospori TaxID=648752 RepID=A0A927MU27_9ACTN|nr:alpha/beta hydrolase [Actinopolymorpha pittospori]MBE1603325.1 pimeloyl-ACP methyl ester carboxylesterase [Actinopolymorpha pittospori]
MAEITVGAARVPYRVMGEGRPLLLVHGTNAGSKSWDGVAGAFTSTSRVVLPDLSGSDATRDDGRALTVELLAGQLAAVISDLGEGPADVVGHSMGAPVVAALAAVRPDLVRSIVLVAGFAGQGDEYFRNALIVMRDLAGDGDTFARFAMLLVFSREHLGSIGRASVEELAAAYRPNAGRLRQIDLDLRLDVRDLLPRVQAPTLVIGCARDAMAPVENSRELAAAIPGASYEEMDSGHIVMAERPKEFVKLVRDFIN